MSTFQPATQSHLKKRLFFDEPVDIARYDQLRYPQFDKLTEKQEGFFWRPSEIDLTRDGRDFKNLLPHEQHIFTANLKRQIMLDSIQGRAPALAFLPIVSVPELEAFITIWTDFERIHNKSYTHILRNVYANPSSVFDGMLEIQEIVECAKDISKYYDALIENNKLAGICGTSYGDYGHKKALWLCLNAVNALEGIRFYVSFACSWAFAEVKKMEGNAKIIKFIARDENVHLAATQQLLKLLPKDDPEFERIKDEVKHEVLDIFVSVVEQERNWAKYLFKDGSIIGLNEELLITYVDWIAHKRMGAIGMESPFRGGSNPLPWTAKWIAGSDIQVAPQQVQISSYIIGGVKQDITDDMLKGLSL